MSAPAKAEERGYDKWQAREDMETVLRADQIRKDPTRMKHVRRAAKEKLAEQTSLRALAGGR